VAGLVVVAPLAVLVQAVVLLAMAHLAAHDAAVLVMAGLLRVAVLPAVPPAGPFAAALSCTWRKAFSICVPPNRRR